eukprot:gene36901-48139_t
MEYWKPKRMSDKELIEYWKAVQAKTGIAIDLNAKQQKKKDWSTHVSPQSQIALSSDLVLFAKFQTTWAVAEKRTMDSSFITEWAYTTHSLRCVTGLTTQDRLDTSIAPL